MIPTTRLCDVAQACLDAVVDYYTAEGQDLPERRYVANGLPAFDATDEGHCDGQLTVFVEATYGIEGNPLQENPNALLGDAGHAMRAAVLAVTIIRCVPTVGGEGHSPQIPSAAEETASAREIYEDAVLMFNALLSAERAGTLPGCGSVAFLRWVNENAQGGVGGGTLRVAVSLSDAF